MVNKENNHETYLGGTPIERHSEKLPRVATSSYAGEIHAVSRRCDTSRFLKSLAAGLSVGNDNADFVTSVRNDNSIVVEHVHSINSVTNGRMFKQFSREYQRIARFK